MTDSVITIQSGPRNARTDESGRTARGRTYTRTPIADRLWQRVEQGPVAVWTLGPCLLWIGSVASHGYGQLMDPDTHRPLLVHRLAYELVIGRSIPSGYELDHLCEIKRCVNVSHLELLSKAEHSRRSSQRLDARRPGWRIGR
jgi:hypothetical protein